MIITHLTIAGVDFEIGCDLEIVNSFLSDAYTEFSGDAPQEHDHTVSVKLLPTALKGVAQLERCFDASDMWSLFRNGETRFITHTGGGIESPMWAAELPLDASSVRVHCGEVLQGRGGEVSSQWSVVSGTEGEPATLPPCYPVASISNPMRYPLDQILMTYVLSRCQGVLLHSAGVLCNGKLWLLAGKSRAGKSTSALLLKGMDGVELLSDDRIVVRKIGSEFIGYGTPWPGEAKIASNKNAPLAGILFLDQSPVNQIDEISATDAFERLMPVGSIPWYEPELFPAVMDFCGVVAESLPMYRLQFRPDADAADMIEKMLKR